MVESQSSGGFQLDIPKVSGELRVRPEIFKRLVLSFSKTSKDKMALLESSLNQGDTITARVLLHELKGTSGNLRLNMIYEAVDVLHVAVKAGEAAENIQQHLQVLKARCQEFDAYATRLASQTS